MDFNNQSTISLAVPQASNVPSQSSSQKQVAFAKGKLCLLKLKQKSTQHIEVTIAQNKP